MTVIGLNYESHRMSGEVSQKDALCLNGAKLILNSRWGQEKAGPQQYSVLATEFLSIHITEDLILDRTCTVAIFDQC